MTKFKATVPAKFIVRRDRMIPKFNAGIRGADAEFIEYHQALVDPFQILYEGMAWDTTHEILGNIDYKQYAKDGVKLSEYCQKQIKAGNVHFIGVWRWLPKNIWEELYEGKVVEYEILDYVDVNLLDLEEIAKTGRFVF